MRLRTPWAVPRPLPVVAAGFSRLLLVSWALILLMPCRAWARTVSLADDWRVQSSSLVAAGGEEVSTSAFEPRGWYQTKIPSTVLAALVANGEYRDLFVGRNLEKVPRDRFTVPWWYRRVFDAPVGGQTRLVFDGLSYRADIWLNGRLVAPASTTFGAFRRFDIDVTGLLREKGNVLAVRVAPAQAGDFNVGFVDWNPEPPDASMGLFRPVSLRVTGPVSIEAPSVLSTFDSKNPREARLAISATLVNHTPLPVRGEWTVVVDSVRLRVPYQLAPRESKAETSSLTLPNPRLWWPAGLGEPNLYTLDTSVTAGGSASDRESRRFGIRMVGDYLTPEGHRGYTVNGRPVLIRGGGWTDDMLMVETPASIDAQLRYVRHMNLNTIRLEGFWGSSQALYDAADRLGLLVLVGWSCEWEWGDYLGIPRPDSMYGGARTADEQALLTACLADQVQWLGHHPSILAWVIGSDKLPYPDAETRFRALLAEKGGGRPVLSSAHEWTSTVSGPSAVKMAGPYDYVTPNYWTLDTRFGGAFGFDTEVGPGPLVPPAESLRAMLPEGSHWPVDGVWGFHCARHQFATLDGWLKAFVSRYGQATNLDDFALRAQASNYEAVRAMFEAFTARRPRATGVVAWMLNSAWPKLYWQLYGHDLVPGGAFYGARKGCQPLSVIYDYSDGRIYAVNQSGHVLPSARVRGFVLDARSKPIYRVDTALSGPLATDSAKLVCRLPALSGSPVHFLALELVDAAGARRADNFYWLSSKPDVLDWDKTTWYVTPNVSYADLTELSSLPAADVEVACRSLGAREVEVTLHNRGENVAFFVDLRVVGNRSSRSFRPVFWDDNDISLLPGETRVLRATWSGAEPSGERPVLAWRGFNVRPSTRVVRP